MKADKKSPMYSSNISSEYQFTDYTASTPSTTPSLSLGKFSKLKQSAMMNSQLIGIQELKEQDITDNQTDCHQVSQLEALMPKKNEVTNRSSKTIRNLGELHIRKALTIETDENLYSPVIQRGNFLKGLQIQQKDVASQPQNTDKKLNEYTGDEIINIMPYPYRDNMVCLISRVKKSRFIR